MTIQGPECQAESSPFPLPTPLPPHRFTLTVRLSHTVFLSRSLALLSECRESTVTTIKAAFVRSDCPLLLPKPSAPCGQRKKTNGLIHTSSLSRAEGWGLQVSSKLWSPVFFLSGRCGAGELMTNSIEKRLAFCPYRAVMAQRGTGMDRSLAALECIQSRSISPRRGIFLL